MGVLSHSVYLTTINFSTLKYIPILIEYHIREHIVRCRRIYPYINITVSSHFKVMFVLCVYSYSELTYNRTYEYPAWSITCGWIMACCSVVWIPILAVVQLWRQTGTLKQVCDVVGWLWWW